MESLLLFSYWALRTSITLSGVLRQYDICLQITAVKRFIFPGRTVFLPLMLVICATKSFQMKVFLQKTLTTIFKKKLIKMHKFFIFSLLFLTISHSQWIQGLIYESPIPLFGGLVYGSPKMWLLYHYLYRSDSILFKIHYLIIIQQYHFRTYHKRNKYH